MNNIVLTNINTTVDSNTIKHTLLTTITVRHIVISKCCFTNSFNNINDNYNEILMSINAGP